MVIRRLKQKILELEAQVKASASVSKSATDRSPPPPASPPPAGPIDMADHSLSPSDQRLCHKVLYEFFHDKIDNPVLAGKFITGKAG